MYALSELLSRRDIMSQLKLDWPIAAIGATPLTVTMWRVEGPHYLVESHYLHIKSYCCLAIITQSSKQIWLWKSISTIENYELVGTNLAVFGLSSEPYITRNIKFRKFLLFSRKIRFFSFLLTSFIYRISRLEIGTRINPGILFRTNPG